MKQLVFSRDDNESYQVRIYDADNNHDWAKYGELVLNEAGNYELWTGTDYSSEGSGLENSSDECVEYTSSLDETYDAMALDLAEILHIF